MTENELFKFHPRPWFIGETNMLHCTILDANNIPVCTVEKSAHCHDSILRITELLVYSTLEGESTHLGAT